MRINGLARNSKALSISASALLITASVVGGWWLVEDSRNTETYLVTKMAMATGSPLIKTELETVELALFNLSESYLKSEELPPGAYLTRPIAAGEAIPAASVTTQFLDDWSNLVLSPAVEMSSRIVPGSTVMVWTSPALDFQSYGEPVIAAVDAEVVAIRKDQSNFQNKQVSVELRVPSDAIQTLLRSISNGDAIALTSAGTASGD